METKICKTKREGVIPCGLTKPKDDFYKGCSLCKICYKQLNKLNIEYRRKYSKDMYQKKKNILKKRVRSIEKKIKIIL
jgi:hypothetical protein